jgi:hypothetical protein
MIQAKGVTHLFLTRGAYTKYVSTEKRRPACAKRFGRLRAKAGFSGEREGRERRLACPILKGGPFAFNIT